MGINRIEASVSRLGNDQVYGNGADGTVIISSSASLSRDMYYKNLTIDSGVTLNTNGYKVFVQGTLTLNGTIGISSGTSVSPGTLTGTTAIATSTTNSLGGSAAGATYTASQMSASTLQWLEAFIGGGVFYNPSGLVSVSGGAGGQNGQPGTVTPATSGSGATSGGAGGAGDLSLRDALQPGGPGTAGTPGTNGQAGSTPPAASAGAGGIGGGIVFVAAKYITGTGAIRSEGKNATAGGPSATGTGATVGTDGTAGTAAPNLAVQHFSENIAYYNYPTGSGTPHASIPAPALPHGYTNSAHYHSPWHFTVYRWVHGNYIHHSNHGGHYNHYYMCPGGHQDNYAHGYNAAHQGSGLPHVSPSDYYHLNNVNQTNNSPNHVYFHHSYSGHYNDTGVVYPHCAWVGGYDKYGAAWYAHGLWPRQHYDRNDHARIEVSSARAVKHSGHLTAAGGTAGAKGLAGTNGTNGSTTAGTDGKSGGGGGIICISDAVIPGTITTSTAGGSLSGTSGSSGMLVTVINQ